MCMQRGVACSITEVEMSPYMREKNRFIGHCPKWKFSRATSTYNFQGLDITVGNCLSPISSQQVDRLGTLGLGESAVARTFSIFDRAEALAYLGWMSQAETAGIADIILIGAVL